VANYNVDIAVALKGAEKLRTFSKQIKDFGDNVKGLNIFLQSFSKGNDGLVRNISNLQKNLSDTAKNFKEVALDTKEATIAAAQYAKASDELNKGLAQQQKLLDDVSGKTAKKTAADNKTLQEALLKLETKQTRNLEEKFETQQKFQKEFKDEINKINQKRKEENKLIKQNVEQTKKTVAEEIKKKFSIIASHKERRKNFNQSLKELRREQRATAQQIPINDRINAQLRKRGLILSSNGKQIIRNNQNRRSGMGGGLGNAIGSGIIGGGFPLLFGQGATAALGGGIGGVAGGLIGGQFGFALSIAGTTIGSTLDQLSKALLKPTENIEMLVNRLGLAGTETGDLALELEKLGLTTSAAELLLKEFETEFGLTADDIKENAETLKTFNNEINKLGTSLTLMMSDVLNPLIKELNNLIKGKRPEGISRGVTGTVDFFTANALDLDKRGQLLDEIAPILNPTKPPKLSNIPPGEQTVNNPDFGKPGTVGEQTVNNPDFGKPGTVNENISSLKKRLQDLKEIAKFNKDILPLQQALEIEQQRSSLTNDELSILKANNNLKKAENTLSVSKQELQISFNTLGSKELKNLEEKIRKERILVNTAKAAVTNAENAKKINDMKNQASLADLDNRIKLQKESLTLLPKELNILQQKNKLSSLESALDIAEAENNQTKINNLTKQIKLQNILIQQAEILANPIQAEMIMLDQQMKQLNDVGMRVVGLSRTIGSSFQESFKGVITGTMSVTDAFRNMTNRIADYFLDMAARMMANQLQRSILGMFGGMFGGGATDVFAGFNRGPTNPNNLTMDSFANGGRPLVGRPSVVGERGPEVFVPDRKGTIIPNHALGGSTNVIVNVDATGSAVEGDEQQGRELGRLISVAVQSELVQQKRPGGLLA
jgi:methyl-accepting chemotaxis protein